MSANEIANLIAGSVFAGLVGVIGYLVKVIITDLHNTLKSVLEQMTHIVTQLAILVNFEKQQKESNEKQEKLNIELKNQLAANNEEIATIKVILNSVVETSEHIKSEDELKLMINEAL